MVYKNGIYVFNYYANIILAYPLEVSALNR